MHVDHIWGRRVLDFKGYTFGKVSRTKWPDILRFFSHLSDADVQWLWNQDASRDLLLAIHPPNYIVLWNADTGTKLWKKSYADNILSFSFDPFDPSHLTCK